jgi:hypothetical protein
MNIVIREARELGCVIQDLDTGVATLVTREYDRLYGLEARKRAWEFCERYAAHVHEQAAGVADAERAKIVAFLRRELGKLLVHGEARMVFDWAVEAIEAGAHLSATVSR